MKNYFSTILQYFFIQFLHLGTAKNHNRLFTNFLSHVTDLSVLWHPREVFNSFSQPNTESMALEHLKSWIKLTVDLKVNDI